MAEIRVLSKEDIMRVMDMKCVLESTEHVYRAKSRGKTSVWPTVFYEFCPGKADLDIKSGLLEEEALFGHKTVAWFSENTAKGLPQTAGVVVIYNADTGMPTAVLEASYLTGVRTGAAGALGAKYLARPDSQNLLLVGTGGQAAFQAAAMLTAFPALKKITAVNPINPRQGKEFIDTLRLRLVNEFGLPCKAICLQSCEDLEKAALESDIIITVTPSRKPLIQREWVRPGTHISCIGADMPGKQELSPQILKDSRLYADDKQHCMEVGEIELPLKAGIIRETDILGELGDVIEGKCPGRLKRDDITVFDATGMALLDIAAAKTVLQLAAAQGLGTMAHL